MPWARSQEGPASLLLGWFAPKKGADSHPFTDPGRGEAENEEPPANPAGGGEECRGLSEAGSKAQSGRGGQWAWALMPSEDHEMGLFPQKKETENKQTTGKAVSSPPTQAGTETGGWGEEVIHKEGLLSWWDFLWGLVIQAPAAFPEVHNTCHPPGGKAGRPRAGMYVWGGRGGKQPQSGAQV